MFEIMPFDRRTYRMSCYNPMRELEQMEKSFWGEQQVNPFRTDISETDDGYKDSYIRRERYYGAYTRSFNVSEIDVEGIKAAYENGVLTLTMPKKAPVKPESKHLEIE